MKEQRKFTKAWTKAREELGIPVLEAARLAGVNASTIYRALSDNGASLRVATLESLCDVVGIQPSSCWDGPRT